MSDSSTGLPSFLIIGAMKCATTTLYEQLLAQTGIFMPSLKEPNYFSDDSQYAKGQGWYGGLFAEAQSGDLLGEASTHYTKLPQYPETLGRMRQLLPEIKLIYVMRHPVDRLVSQYVHEWSQGKISGEINSAIETHPELVAYSRYGYQLQPFIDAYGRQSILPLFFESVKSNPQLVLEEVCRFIGYKGKPEWKSTLAPSNVSKDRIRKFPFYNLLIESVPAQAIRRAFVPQKIRDKVKHRLQMRQRPVLNEQAILQLQEIFDQDLCRLNEWFGIEINCENFKSVAAGYIERHGKGA